MNLERLIALLLGVLAMTAKAGSPWENWHARNPTPTLNRLNGVAYGNGRYVAVGGVGTVLVSADAVNWAQVSSGTSQRLNAVVFSQGRFVAGGDRGTILWSQDGTNWNGATVTTSLNITSVGFGQGSNLVSGLFVAFASQAPLYESEYPATVVLTSGDGAVWATHSSSEAEGGWFAGITWGKERFVASVPPVGTASQAILSSRGTNWQYVLGFPQGPIAYGNGVFVDVNSFSVSNSGTTVNSATSSDGYSWAWASGGGGGVSAFAYGLCFGGGRFVTGGEHGYTASSPDGTNWSVQVANTDSTFRSVVYGDGLYVAVGDGGAIFSSTDGSSWIRRSHGPGRTSYAIAPDGDGFVTAGEAGTLGVSSNGVDWTELVAPTTNALYAAGRANDRYVFAGANGTIVSGNTLANLAPRPSGTTQALVGVAFGVGTFVSVGSVGTVTVSTNATDWSVQPSSTTNNLASVVYGKGLFVAVGDAGAIVTSSNGLNWSRQISGVSGSLSDVVFGNGRFVACQPTHNVASRVVVSFDATNWVTVEGLYPLVLGFGGGFFLMPDGRGPLLNVSPDGVLWSTSVIQSNIPGLFALAFNNGTFVSAGSFGGIVQSDPIVTTSVLYDGLAHVAVDGPKGRMYRVQANDGGFGTNGWSEVTTLSAPPYSWNDPQSVGKSNRFYRAVLVE